MSNDDDLIKRLEEYALDWRTRAASKDIVEEAIAALRAAASTSTEAVPAGVDRILRAWDAGREVGVEAMRLAVEKMLREWQADMNASGLVSEYNQGNVLLDRLAALTPPTPKVTT